MSLVPTLFAAALIGLTLGLLGGGGSILTVPVLIYLAGVPAKSALATSLFVVGVTSLAGLVAHARAGRVRWRTGLLFGAAGMVGAYTGGRIAAYIPAAVLLIGFGLMMAATAVAMLRGANPAQGAAADPAEPAAVGERHLGRILGEGAVVGLVTGLVGAGGGFLVVPALVLLGGLSMPVAVGTSLLVIAMKSAAGLAGYLHTVSIDWPLALTVTAVAVAGGLVGGRLAGRVDAMVLRRSFGWFVVVMSVVVLGGQAPEGVRSVLLRPAVGVPLVVAGVLVATGGAVLRRRRSRVSGPAVTPAP